jgi:hypothetical protein
MRLVVVKPQVRVMSAFRSFTERVMVYRVMAPRVEAE